MKSANLFPEEIKQIITAPNLKTRDEFVGVFSADIADLCKALSSAHECFNGIWANMTWTDRAGWSQAFLYAAFDSLVSSAHLLVFGHVLPAGHLIRCWFEAVCMALLCSNKHAGTFGCFIKDPDGFRVDMEVRKTFENERCAEMLCGMQDALGIIRDLVKFYNQHSHTSAFAARSRHLMGDIGQLSLAGEYDPNMNEYYKTELAIYAYMADLMPGITNAVEKNLNNPSGQ